MDTNLNSTRDQYPLSRKKIIKKTINTVVQVAFYLIPFSFFFIVIWISALHHSFQSLWILYGVILICAAILGNVFQRAYFRSYFYDITSDHIIIRKGVFSSSEITVAYERIQDIYMDQDVLDKMFGLYDVHISTATMSSGIEAHIDGLESESAHTLRDMLITKWKQKIGRSTPSV